MDRKWLAVQIAGVLDSISRLQSNVCAMGSLDIQRCPENYEALSTQAALTAEKLACKLRRIIFATTRVPRSEYMVSAGEAHGIEVEQEDGILKITLPCLLPKKQSRQSALFLGDPLHAALEEYVVRNPLPRLRECVVCFCHVYAQDRLLWQVRDADNQQQKQVLDLISLFFLTDDNGLLCSTYTTAERGDHTHTRVYVMPKERFPKWLLEHEKNIQNGP